MLIKLQWHIVSLQNEKKSPTILMLWIKSILSVTRSEAPTFTSVTSCYWYNGAIIYSLV